MNLGDIKALVRVQLRDEDERFVPPADVTKWVNVAQREIAERLGLLEGETLAGVTIAPSRFAIPADYITASYLEVAGEKVEFVSHEEFERTKDGDLGWPYAVAHAFNGHIEIAPNVAVGTTYDLRYIKGPTDLAADSDIPAIPVELHPRLAWFGTAMALLKEREEGLADRFFELYSSGLPPSGLGQGRVKPGPMRLRREPSAWDISGTHVGVGGHGD